MTTNLALELFKRIGTQYNIWNTYEKDLSELPWYPALEAAILKCEKSKKLAFWTMHKHFSCMMWLWHDHLKRYFTELVQLKYKLIISIKTMGCCGLACVVWLKSCEFSKRKSVLIVGNSSMMCLLQKFLNLTYMWTFFIFYETEWTCWVYLLPIRSQEHLKEIQAFEAAIWCLRDQ